jgi:transcriptional regulator with XRE-family HTH domain
MASQSIQQRIALMISAKRREMGNLGVRQAAKAAGISSATFSRLGRGESSKLPDVSTLTKLAEWLGVSVSDLVESRAPSQSSPLENTVPEILDAHLRADKNLTPVTAKALSEMFKALYNQAALSKRKK